VAQEFMASHMDLITPHRLGSEDFSLLWCRKSYGGRSLWGAERIHIEQVLETFIFPDVVVVGDILPQETTNGS
jgi:hypothetical protein